jgi:beta-barrel assembly-enhancing protease
MHIVKILLAGLLIGAAPALDPGLEALRALDLRVATIGYRLKADNRDLCTVTAPQTGLLLHSLGQYAPNARAIAKTQFGLGLAPAVLDVVPGSVAAKAGLLPRDHIMAINGQAMPTTLSARADYAAVQTVEDALAAALRTPPATLKIMRAGQARIVLLTGDPACASRFIVRDGKKLGASADGVDVSLTGRIVDFTQGVDELAVVMGHEFAHNVLHHGDRLDRSGRAARFVRATEIEADYVGLYLTARAGYDPAAGARFYARFGKKTDYGILSDGTHLRWKERVALAQRTLAEIRKKQAGGQPLIPSKTPPI